MSYETVPIGKLCIDTDQHDPRALPDQEFEYVDISSIDRELKTIVGTQTIVGKDAPSRARKLIRSGDVLVSTVRPNLNAVAVVPAELDGQIASTGFCVLRANSEVLDYRYLFFRTLTPEFIGHLTAQMRGANYPAVTDAVVKSVLIPIPPIERQRRIAEILEQVGALRKKQFESRRLLEGLFYSLLHQAFEDTL